jgi:hypothetical protein
MCHYRADTLLILETSPCGHFSNLRDDQKVRCGILRTVSVRHWLTALPPNYVYWSQNVAWRHRLGEKSDRRAMSPRLV